MRSVGELVRRQLEDIKVDKQAFIALVGSNSGDMSKILSGKRQVPRDKLDLWCEHLQLKGRALSEFRTAVHLTWATPEIRDLVVQLRDAQIDARALVAYYEDRVGIIEQHVASLSSLRGRLRPPPDEP